MLGRAAGVPRVEEMEGLVWTGIQFTRDFPIDYTLLLVLTPPPPHAPLPPPGYCRPPSLQCMRVCASADDGSA